jgi:hypothetical protein
MLRVLLRWLSALALWAALCVPGLAQAPGKDEGKEPRNAVPETAIALLITVLVLAVICIPSRKQQ